MSLNLCKNNIPGPLADSFCNNLVKQLDNFRNSNSLPQCQSKILLTKGEGANGWEKNVFQSTRIISTIQECELITNVILNHARDENKQVLISVDCEGVDLGINGIATSIAIGTTQDEAFLFDILTCPEMVNDGGLKSILEHEKIIKIIHNCRRDSVNLKLQFGVNLKNVFDTQVANDVIFYQNNSFCKLVSLNKLCENYKVPTNPMKNNLKYIYATNYEYWKKRPLTSEMILYAASDVLVLLNKNLYDKMARSIYPSSQSMFSRRCSDKILAFF